MIKSNAKVKEEIVNTISNIGTIALGINPDKLEADSKQFKAISDTLTEVQKELSLIFHQTFNNKE